MRINAAPPNLPKLSRRNFLKMAGAASVAAAMPAIVPGSALGLDGSVAPSNRVNMGFIGLGGQGTGHLLGGGWTYVPGGYMARKDVQVLAVCDVDQRHRQSARERCNRLYAEETGQSTYNGVKDYNDFLAVLARPDIDAVLIAVPYHWAAILAVTAMRAGKDVYCEKPIAVSIREGQAVRQVSRRFERVYQAGTQQRSEYGGKFRIACDLVRNGRIGQLKEVYAYCLPGALYPSAWISERSVPKPPGLDWDRWLGPLPWRPYGGEYHQTMPGLFIGDVNWGPHHYDIIQWTVNPDFTQPFEAHYEDGQVHYRYSNGVVVHSQGYPGERIGPDGGACFVGTEGRIAVDRGNLVSYPARILQEPLHPNDSRVYHADSHSGNFLECIRNRRLTICDPDTAVYSMNALLVGGIALALQRAVKWDPVKTEFVNDEEANRLRSWAPRPPWGV